jgi:hypothetical protein
LTGCLCCCWNAGDIVLLAIFLVLVLVVNGDRNVVAGDHALVQIPATVAVVPSALLPTLLLLACLLL